MSENETRSSCRSKPASSIESVGDRLRFTVELPPNETTIVSWEKLLKQANNNPPRVPTPIDQPVKQKKLIEDEPAPNRLSNVIERIERMYAGNGSSDEEDGVLDDVPDDDEYDTEDSFIDDAELDDYFQVDNSEIKHGGFFVNRGQLERAEPTITTTQQPKKGRRKDMEKGVTSDDGNNPIKQAKTASKGRKASSVDKNLSTQSQKVVEPNSHHKEITTEISVKNNSADFKVSDSLLGPSNGNVRVTDHHEPGVISPKNQHMMKETAQFLEPSTRRSKNNEPPSREALPTSKSWTKDGSAVRPKMSKLDKAIKELEKIVAESRPPSVEVQDPDSSFKEVKKRLAAEIKQRLAKVAIFAQASHGEIPNELVSRLMGIVGHLMQLRTLRKNLSMGLSAKQDKDDQVQKLKQEVAEMVNLRIPHLKSKLGEQTENSDDFQEAGPEEKLRYNMGDALENKICDLYDLYVERLEEHSGPPIRRLYEELVAIWPSGVMDTDGIKRAIHRAKDRRKVLANTRKDQENIKKRKSVVPKAENTNLTEATNITSSSNPTDAVTINAIQPKKKVKRKPNVDESEAQFCVDNTGPHAEERYKHQKHASASITKPTPQAGSENLS